MFDEHHLAFDCFGGRCAVRVAGDGPLGTPEDAAEAVRRRLLAWHDEFSRFLPGSALSRLNADPSPTVRAGATMRLLARAVVFAGEASGGLVDATLCEELEDAGYAEHLEGPGVALTDALIDAPPRWPAGPDPARRWAGITVDDTAGTITRRPGLRLDGGGVAKGLFADLLGTRLQHHARHVVDCCGDLRLGGTRQDPREVGIESPFQDGVLHTFQLASGAVATSSIGRRAWLDHDGAPAHHLLDPATGLPAYTGIVQASALAPTALEAEWRAKAALLSGPDAAPGHLPHGGLLVLDDGRSVVLDPPAARPRITVRRDAAARPRWSGESPAVPRVLA